MKYYYCNNCKKMVGGQMSNTQVAVAVLLCIIFAELLCIPGIFYIVLCERKCPVCGLPVQKVKADRKNNLKEKTTNGK